MRRLNELIQTLCPNGVPFVELGTIAKGEKERNKGKQCDLAFSITKGGLVKTSDYFKDATVTSEDTSGYKIVRKNWFVYSPSRIDVGSINYLKDEEMVIVSPLNVVFSICENKILPQYLLYFLQSRSGTWQILTKREGIEGTGRKLLPFERFSTIILPLPPIEIQREVVKILDNFENLISELTAELTVRKQQYEHYRNVLLTFDGNTRFEKLGISCNMKSGKAIQAAQIAGKPTENTPYACFGGNGIRGYVSHASHHGDFPIIGRQGALCGNINYATGDFYATEHAVVVESKGDYLQRFLYYLLISMNLNQYKSQGAQPGLAVGNLENLIAPVPSIKEQEHIVSILDRFEVICNDLSAGLPAEIEARQKQYEYYRDKLLSFKKKE